MYEHKIIVAEDGAIAVLQKEGWELCTIHSGKMYFKRKARVNRKKPVKQEEELWYNKSTVSSLCSYAFDPDFAELYAEWRKERKLSKSYKTPFNEASEKRVFSKLNKTTKKVALAMLDRAIEMKWLTLYDLQGNEKEKIMVELREDQKKQEAVEQGIRNEEERKKALETKDKVTAYINTHYQELYNRAEKEVEESFNLEGPMKKAQIEIKMRILAKQSIS